MATDERMTLNLPTLGAAGTKRLLELLRKELNCEAKVSRAAMNLEEFFISVVNEAKESGTGGTVPESRIAPFLCC